MSVGRTDPHQKPPGGASGRGGRVLVAPPRWNPSVRSDALTALSDLARPQSGSFTLMQAARAGLTAHQVNILCTAGVLRATAAGVYRFEVVGERWETALWTGWLQLGPSAVISHDAAAPVHHVPTFARGAVVFTVPHGHDRGLAVGRVHVARRPWAPKFLVDAFGLPCTGVPATLVDLATFLRPARFEHVLEEVLAARSATVNEIGVALAAQRRQGRRGVTMLGAMLDERGDAYVPRASDLERLLDEAIALAGLGPLPRQAALPGRGAIEGLVDRSDPEARVIIEGDSRRWHTRKQDFARDRLRDQEAARAGWLTLRIVREQLVTDMADAASLIRTVHDDRVRLLRAARPA